MTPKVLIVLTSFGDILDSTGKSVRQTGWYLPELAHPYEILSGKAELVIASPKGGVAPLDPNSLQPWVQDDESSANFFNTKKAVWENTAKILDFLGRADEFEAIFYPGGHGPMFDLAINQDSIALISEFWTKGKVVAAVCHGPAAFVNVKLPNSGEYILKGKNVSAFSSAEEYAMDMSKYMPFVLEDKINADGAIYHKASELWAATVQVSGNLITGQNPASAKGVGEAIAKALAAGIGTAWVDQLEGYPIELEIFTTQFQSAMYCQIANVRRRL
ncbi:ThiJ/PfpI family protein [Hypoxylon trugodes]|uniref:ThiJ/PfpI family protein n=1 Tax=Hypoxylon trugodes TaxID=326681 RepID=UPI00219D3D4E|nr:ThiJ/PfpI family protein [Hypoxylon trugodes]KAI1390328.1 ThiJ/PfpI family protein [Hypoxylon trugodes]